MLIRAFLLSSLIALAPAAYAHDNGPATIDGTNIHLFERSHGFAGEIAGHPVFGAFEHEPFGAKLQIRRNEKTHEMVLTHTGAQYTGMIAEARAESVISTRVELVKVTKTGPLTGDITLNVDGVETIVHVTGKTFADNHFQEPKFETTLNGTPVSFQFTGEACFGYSSNLAMMILGAAAHLQK